MGIGACRTAAKNVHTLATVIAVNIFFWPRSLVSSAWIHATVAGWFVCLQVSSNLRPLPVLTCIRYGIWEHSFMGIIVWWKTGLYFQCFQTLVYWCDKSQRAYWLFIPFIKEDIWENSGHNNIPLEMLKWLHSSQVSWSQRIHKEAELVLIEKLQEDRLASYSVTVLP